MLRYTLILLLLLLPFRYGIAQTGVSAADRYLTRANLFMGEKNLRKAEQFYKKALNAAPHSPEVYSILGKFYFDQGRYQDASYVFESGTKSCSGGTQIFAIPLANALMRSGNAEKAGIVLRGYRVSPQAKPQLKEEVAALQRSIDFGRLIGYHKYNVKVTLLGDSVNSVDDDYFPSFSGVRKDLIFTRRSNGLNEDFFISTLDSCGDWTLARDMGFPLNSPFPECAQVRSFNDKYMIYQKCDNRSPNGWEMGGCDLYLSYATAFGWSVPRPFGYTINTTAYEGMPALASDETALYFVSDREGGYGGKDIWVSYFKKGYWQVPENLGPGINTDKDELTPVIAADGKTLYFASKGHSGFGGFDMFVSRQQPDGKWAKAMNLGTPANSNYDELCGTVILRGDTMYFASNRPGGYGGLDIYTTDLPKDFRPVEMAMLCGSVKDFESGTPVTLADITVQAPETQVVYNLRSNKGDGSFYLPLPAGKTYQVSAAQRYYNELSDTFRLYGLGAMDTLQLRMLPKGYVPNKKTIALLQLNMADSALLRQDSFCLVLNRALAAYSGKITGLELNSFVLRTDDGWLYDYSAQLKECLFKIGVTEEYITNNIWEVAKDAPSEAGTDVQPPGMVLITLEYLE